MTLLMDMCGGCTELWKKSEGFVLLEKDKLFEVLKKYSS